MNATVFIATTGQGIARAERGGNGAWPVERLLTDQDVRCLALNPLAPDVVYAGTQGNGVLRSNDRGRTWQATGLAGQMVKSVASLAVSRAEPGTVYAGTKPPLLFVSRNGGGSWTELTAFRRIRWRWLWRSPAEPPFTAYVQAIALSPSDPDVIVVGIEAGATVRSGDGGRTWSGHRQGALRDCHSLTFHATNGDWVYAGGGSGAGASVSQSAGDVWVQERKGMDRRYGWACAADPANPEVWYVSAAPSAGKAHGGGSAEAHIFRSGGHTPWEKLSGGLPQPLAHMPYALLTDIAAPGHVYAGLSNGDVWHSADHGNAWRQLPLNLGGIHRTLVML
jgi:photosystem II stability/assembly factor-like uncharacterized protein